MRVNPCFVAMTVMCGLVGLSAGASSGKNTELSTWLSQQIQATVNASSLKKKHLGLVVSYKGQDKHKNIFTLNAKQKFIPASLTKLLTAAASLEELGPGHKFSTQIMATSPIKDNVLKGDLYLKGGGDPSFVSESMWKLVNEFLRSGALIVEGDIVVDDSLFDSVRFSASREDSRVDRAYDAPVGAMSFNWNAANIYVRPGKKTGKPVRVFVDPTNEYIDLHNSAVTAPAKASEQLKVTRKKLKRKSASVEGEDFSGDTIAVGGRIPIDHGEKVIYKNITKPDYWSGYNLLAFLQQRRIEVHGGVKVGEVPSKARVVAEKESPPLRQIVADLMKYSNNFVAEMLTKNLAVDAGEKPATLKKGIKKIRAYCKKQGFQKKNFTVANPSGLTRKNQLRPVDLHRLLLQIKTKFRYFPEYLSALPIAGVDGTLEKRLNGSPTEGWLRAKTGRLDGVAGLAGYAGRQGGERLKYVFLFNGKAQDTDKAQKLFDRLAELLVQPRSKESKG